MSNTSTPLWKRVAATLFAAALTIAMLVAMVSHNSYTSQLKKGGVTVKGTIARVEEQRGRRGRIDHYPVVSFKTEDGTSMTVRTSQSGGFSAGQEVEVIYLPKTPDKAEIVGADVFDAINIFGILAVVCLVGALYNGYGWWSAVKNS